MRIPPSPPYRCARPRMTVQDSAAWVGTAAKARQNSTSARVYCLSMFTESTCSIAETLATCTQIARWTTVAANRSQRWASVAEVKRGGENRDCGEFATGLALRAGSPPTLRWAQDGAPTVQGCASRGITPLKPKEGLPHVW